MSVFGRYLTEGSSLSDIPSEIEDVTLESLLEDDSIQPCEENFVVAGARICAENTINMNNIMEACAIGEFQCFEESGTEMIYEAGAFSKFFESAKNFFKKLWEKIQGLFKKALLFFNSKTKDDKAFFNKYKKQINSARNSDYGDKEISMYDYVFFDGPDNLTQADIKAITDQATITDSSNINDIINKIGKGAGVGSKLASEIDAYEKNDDNTSPDEIKRQEESIKNMIDKVNESDWKKELLDIIRGGFVREGEELTASEFPTELANAIRGNDGEKEDIAMRTAVDKSAKFLEESNKIVKDIDNILKWWKKEIDNTIRALTRTEKELSREMTKSANFHTKANNYRHTCIANAIAFDKDVKNIGVVFHSTSMRELKACSGQSKSIIVQAINYKKPKNESYVESYEGDDYSNLLEDVQMI